uniref:MAK10-like protein n=1 Tax=Tanacetum cinerariifolium TaxID=118510 RepID=A0A6L2JTL1_TANCI|nr:MAK10-like protein [Tanacetum cinerariifolium]
MGDENPICTLGDYSKPIHEGYRNTIELSVRNNVDFLQKVPHHGINLWLQVQIFYDHVNPVTRQTINQSSGDVPSTSDRRLIELENQVQRLMEAHLALTQPTQVNKVTTSCEICSGPHDTQYCMEDPKQAFVEYASSCTNKAGEGLVSNFMASQDARLTKFETDFKQQKSKMTNKIDTVLKPITDQIAGALPSDTVKNQKLSTSPVLFAHSYPNMDPQCSTHIYGSINAIIIHFEKQSDSYDEKAKENKKEENDSLENIHISPSTPPNPSVAFIIEKVLKFNSFFESLGLVPQSSDTEVETKETTSIDVLETVNIDAIDQSNEHDHSDESRYEDSESDNEFRRPTLNGHKYWFSMYQ